MGGLFLFRRSATLTVCTSNPIIHIAMIDPITGRDLVTLLERIAGEDLTLDILKVEERYTGTNVTADTLVKTGAGFVHTVTIACTDAAPTAGSIVLYNNTAESGTIIQTIAVTTAWFAPVTLVLDQVFTTGLYVGFTTTADVNVNVSYR